MGCNLHSALKDSTKCHITMAGTGDRVYFFDKDAWIAAMKRAGLSSQTLPTPGSDGTYNDSLNQQKFECLKGLLYPVDVKTDSGQVTSEKSADNEANSLVGTFVVSDNVDGYNILEHALRFLDFGALIPRTGGGYYVIMSPWKKTTIESNYDSGTTYDSDHGFTVTLTASPAEYGITTWNGADAELSSTDWRGEDKDDIAETTTILVYSTNTAKGRVTASNQTQSLTLEENVVNTVNVGDTIVVHIQPASGYTVKSVNGSTSDSLVGTSANKDVTIIASESQYILGVEFA